MEQYSTFDISRILDIPKGRILDWLRHGFISPSIKIAQGHGKRNIFSRWDVYGIEIFYTIIDDGTSREWAKKIFDYFQKETLNLPIRESKNLYILVCSFLTTEEDTKRGIIKKIKIY